MVKSTVCSSRVSEFDSKQPHVVSNHLYWDLGPLLARTKMTSATISPGPLDGSILQGLQKHQLASALTTVECLWEKPLEFKIKQLHFKTWKKMELIPQHLSSAQHLRQSLWTICRSAISMSLSNYRKMYASASVGFQYLRSVVDKYAGKAILDTRMCLKCIYLKSASESYWSFVISFHLLGVETSFLKQRIASHFHVI